MKGWRTILFNGVVAALGAVDATSLVDVLPNEYIPLAVTLVGAVNMILRALTNTPVGKKF